MPKPDPIKETVAAIISYAERVGESHIGPVIFQMPASAVKSLAPFKRMSARREIQIGNELSRMGRGKRNDDRTFTVVSSDGPAIISFSEAQAAHTASTDREDS
jgi:hypothetical protein